MRSRPALLLVLLLFVAACASGSPSRSPKRTPTPSELLDAARARTSAAPSGEFTVTISGPGVDRTSDGAFDAPNHRYRYRPEPATEFRSIEGRVYVRSADVARRVGVATEWMTGRVDDPAAVFNASDPLAFMDLLGGATGSVTRAGDGRYTLTVSVSAALANAAPPARGRLHAALAADLSSASLLDQPLALTVRIDASGHVDQAVIDLGNNATLTVGFEHLGDPVVIDPPPPSQVTDVGAMLGR